MADDERGRTIAIPGPYLSGPDYEVGYANGFDGRPAASRESEVYMNGWADGYKARQETRIVLRDIDNRDGDTPYEFEGEAQQIIGYLDGPLRRDLRDPAASIPALSAAIEAVREGDLPNANEHLKSLGVHLRRPE